MNQSMPMRTRDEAEREQRISGMYLSMFAFSIFMTVIMVGYMNSLISVDPYYAKSRDVYLADNQGNIPSRKVNF